MAEESSRIISEKKYAVVTGANKGIGFEICRQLASNGITVILTARDEKRGFEALEKLKKASAFSHDSLFFHKLDVTDSASVAAFAGFIKSQFGKLDILVNNAGILGAIINDETLRAIQEKKKDWYEKVTLTYDVAVECLETNYYGAKRLSEALLPFLQLSNSPTIVNVSSESGKLQYIPNEWAKNILSNAENMKEESIDQVLKEFLKDFKGGNLKAKDWPSIIPPYTLSKAAMNAYTRILAKKYPNFRINSVCPGYVQTDINSNSGFLTVEEGAESPVRLAMLPNDGPSGVFFSRKEVSSF